MVGVFSPPRHKGTKKLNGYVVNHTTRTGNIELDLYILSSCEDISQEQANRIIDRMEAARDDALQHVERIQEEVNKRLATLKQQTQKQAVETRKAVADAAWWLFNTAFASLVASAIAGAFAVTSSGLFVS